MIAQINMRKGTSAEWAAASPVVLLAGESGYDTTLKRYKVGDGETEWANLEWNTLWSRPVGCIYESTVSTSPAELFGGTWSTLGGRFLIGADETYPAGTTGGAATHSFALGDGYAKILVWEYNGNTIINQKSKSVPNYAATLEKSISGAPSAVSANLGAAAELGGSTSAGDTMPPFLAVYRWVRTA